MRTVFLSLVFLACPVQSRRTQTRLDKKQTVAQTEAQAESSPKNSLATFLFAKNPVTRFPQVRAAHANGSPTMVLGARKRATEMPTIRDWAGVTKPLDFFDPIGFTTDISEGRKRFYREVELKHGRLAMLAALGFLVGEQFHPLFGGDIDVPSYIAFQETLSRLPIPSNYIYPAILLAIAIPEIFSVFTFDSPLGGEPWSIREDHQPGDLGFDPLGLKPENAEELKQMQTKELNNGRLAMLGAAGMIAQELVTDQKLF